ncbi:Cystatin-A2 [Diplonema papillatum]|nr:Cystatin-A2 [Diplonema papillatum]
MLGGTKEARDLTAEEKSFVTGVRAKVEEKAGGALAAFEPVQIRAQTVAGTNYFVKISAGEGKYVHARIHKPLSGEPTVAAVKTGLADADELQYFEA